MTDAEFYDVTRRWERGEITFADYMEAIGPLPHERALTLLDEWFRWGNLTFLFTWAAPCAVIAACVFGPTLGWLPAWTEHLGLVPLLAWPACLWRFVRRERRLNAEIRAYLESHP
jgi:hypothetical protein